MSDVTKASGPEGPFQTTGSKEKRLPSDKEAFQKKMEKVDEADPEEKKKRRQREEEAEEAKATVKQAHEETSRKDRVKPFEVAKSMTTKASMNTGSPKAPQKSDGAPTAIEGADTESLFLEEDDLDLTPIPGITDEIEAKELSLKEAANITKPTPPQKPKDEPSSDLDEMTIEELENAELGKQSDRKEKELKKEESLQQIVKEAASVVAPPPSLAPGSIAPPSPAVTPVYTHLPAEIAALFDRMVGVMTVITTSGVTETTISLDAPQFESSLFFGSEITIREYSTAPKAFNIELKGNVQAVAQFQANIPSLEQAFKAGNYRFKVNRIDTSLMRIPESSVKDKDQEDKEREGES